MRTLLLAALLVATTAQATVIHMSGFDIVDGSGTNTDLLTDDWVQTLGGGATDADMDVITDVADADLVHGVNNLGSRTSHRSLSVNPESGEQAYISLPSGVTLNSSLPFASMSYHVEAIPSGERTIFEFREGANRGCNYRIQSDGKIKAYYDTELQNTSADAFYVKHCVSPYQFIGCVNNTDCKPTAQTCTAGSAYWPELEFGQINAGSAGVSCDLWWTGRQQWATTYDTTPAHTPANVTDVRIGAPGTEAVALNAYVDDVVIGTDTQVGHGAVGFLYPDANGATSPDNVNTFSRDSCSGGSTDYWACVNNYASAGVLNTGLNGTLRAAVANRTATIQMSETVSAELTNNAIPAVEWFVIGRTNADSGSGSVRTKLQVCTGGTCSPLSSVTTSVTWPVSSPIIYGRQVENNAPTGLWGATALDAIELVSTIVTIPASTFLRLSAMGVYYQIKKPEVTEEPVLADHDEGADDGLKTICLLGDSLLDASASVPCSNNVALPCNQDTYCSWDAPNGSNTHGDLPSGGCSTNTECRTCKQNGTIPRTGNGGAGVPCSSDAQCPQSAGNPVGALATCDIANGKCDDNASIPCSSNSDCIGWGASCDGSATCDDACPGTNPNGSQATCPTAATKGSWGNSLVGKVAVDNIISCSVSGERLYDMIKNRFASVVGGTYTDCKVVTGTTAPCDYVIVMEGGNDLLDFFASPTCAEASSVLGPGSRSMLRDTQYGLCRDNCTQAQRDIKCTVDSDCSSISSDSRCVGATNNNETTLNGYACLKDNTDEQCSRKNFGTNYLLGECSVDADCPGGTCSINDATKRKFGFCLCDADADCGDTNTWKCVGSQCRRKCTVDSTCLGAGVTRTGACVTAGGANVCAGRCTCPCNARSCSTDEDCSTFGTVRTNGGDFWKWQPRGRCSAGKCTQCGPEICPTGGFSFAYQHTMRTLAPSKYADMMDYMKEYLAALPTGGDGGPVLIVVEHPAYGAGNAVCADSGSYFSDPGYLRSGSARAAARGHHVVTGIRAAYEDYGRNHGWNRSTLTPTGQVQSPPVDLYVLDGVHMSAIGGDLISDMIAADLNKSNSCTTGSGATLTSQRYCLNYVTDTYATSGGPNSDGTCTTSATCGARETCSLRPCTTNTDCPSTATGDVCHAE